MGIVSKTIVYRNEKHKSMKIVLLAPGGILITHSIRGRREVRNLGDYTQIMLATCLNDVFRS